MGTLLSPDVNKTLMLLSLICDCYNISGKIDNWNYCESVETVTYEIYGFGSFSNDALTSRNEVGTSVSS